MTRTRRGRARLTQILLLGILFVGAVVFLFPFVYMVLGSLLERPGDLIPNLTQLTLQNYADMAARVPIATALLNSGIYAGIVVTATLIVGSVTGYALARLEFRGRNALLAVVLLLQLVPFTILMIPLYIMIVRDFGLADSYAGIALPGAVNAVAIFIFRQFFITLPQELFDAPRIDGASELQILWHVALPLIRPAALTVILLTFIGPWNDFLWPFLVTKDQAYQPLAVALANYLSAQAGNAESPMGAVLACSVVLAVPLVVLFAFFQRQFTETDLSSGLKG